MNLQELKEDKEQQKKEENIWINEVLPKVQKEMDILSTKFDIVIEPHLIINEKGITAGIRIKKRIEENPYKRK